MTDRLRRRRATAPKPVREVVRGARTEAEYRELIQKHIDKARSDQSIAERLAEEARLRFGVDVPKETE